MDGFGDNSSVQYREVQDPTATDFFTPHADVRTSDWMLARNLERPVDYSGPTFSSEGFNCYIPPGNNPVESHFPPPQASHGASAALPDLSHIRSARLYGPNSLPSLPESFPGPQQSPIHPTRTEEHPSRPRNRNSKKHVHKDEEWNQHIPTIRWLYVDKNLSLEETMSVMAKEHDFHASQRTYKKKLDERGVWKNLPSSVAHFIVEKRRQREGKPTDFVLYGNTVSLEKVEEAVKRSRIGAPTRPDGVPIQTPTGLKYSTPRQLAPMPTPPIAASTLEQCWTPLLEPSTPFPSYLPLMWRGYRAEDIVNLIEQGEEYERSHDATMAESKYREALSAYEHLLSPTHHRTLEISYRLAELFASQKLMQKADEVLDRMNRIIVGQWGLSHQTSNAHFLRISNMYREWGRHEDAEILIQRLVETLAHSSSAAPVASVPVAPVPSIRGLLRSGRTLTSTMSTTRSTIDLELKLYEAQMTKMSTANGLMMLRPQILATMENCMKDLTKLHIQLLKAAALLVELSDSMSEGTETEITSLQRDSLEKHSESACLTVLREREGILDLCTVGEIVAVVDKHLGLRYNRGTSTVERILELLCTRVDEDFTTKPLDLVITYVHITHMYASRNKNDEMKAWFESTLSRSIALLCGRCTLEKSLESVLDAGSASDVINRMRETVEELVMINPLLSSSR